MEAPSPAVLAQILGERAKKPGGSSSMAPGQVAGGLVQHFYMGGSPAAKNSPPLLSSPRRHSGDDDQNLERYIKWLISLRPQQRTQLENAREKLVAEGFG